LQKKNSLLLVVIIIFTIQNNEATCICVWVCARNYEHTPTKNNKFKSRTLLLAGLYLFMSGKKSIMRIQIYVFASRKREREKIKRKREEGNWMEWNWIEFKGDEGEGWSGVEIKHLLFDYLFIKVYLLNIET